jgi:hypothetical protein
MHGINRRGRTARTQPRVMRRRRAKGFADQQAQTAGGGEAGGGQGRCRRAEAMRASARGIGALVLGSTSETVTCEAAECYAAAPVNGWNTAHTHAETGFFGNARRVGLRSAFS